MMGYLYPRLTFLLLVALCCTVDADESRHHRRQVPDGTNRNPTMVQPKPGASMPFNNPGFNPSNNMNILASNDRNSANPAANNQQLLAMSPPQAEPVRSRGFYNSPAFQPPPFSGGKPAGWFGTNHFNWVSNQQSELDKNKAGAAKSVPANSANTNFVQPKREDGGLFLLEKVARDYASKGEKAFKFGQYETREGRGAVCENYENFNGFTYGRFPCPLPASTGMNQLDQFCCGMANYQYCCNVQEFSQTQRGAFGNQQYTGAQRSPQPPSYSSSTKKVLAIVLPIASFIVLAGIAIVVVLYYKKFRKEQYRTGKPVGAIRLQDNYAVVPQDAPVESGTLNQYEQ